MNTDFLKSNRFWSIVIAALSVYAQAKGWIGDPEMVLIATITGGYVAVRTIDRSSDKKVEAAKIAAKGK